MRQMSLVAFLQAQNCTTLPAAWRHPDARTDSMSPDYYRHIGHVLEAGKFDIGFFDDRLAMPDLYTNNHAHTVAHGIRCIKMDPLVVLMTMGMATERLGLGAAYGDLKSAAAQHGRDPESMKITTLAFPVVGESMTEAEDKRAAYHRLTTEVDALSLLSEALNFDFGRKSLDEPFTDEELAGIEGIQALRDHVLQDSGKPNPTARDFMHFSGRGRLGNAWVGGPKELADRFEDWFINKACDGFVIGPTHIPGAFEDFVSLVVPELQRRGLFRKEYTGTTLRDHLGLVRPAIASWQQ